MKDKIFSQFKVFNQINQVEIDKKRASYVAYEHFVDIRETFGLGDDSYLVQVGFDSESFLFEIRYPHNLILLGGV